MKLGWRWDHQLVQQWVWNWRRRPLKNCILIIFSSFVSVRTIRVYILKDQCDFSYKSHREYWTNLCDWIWNVSRIVDISFLDVDAMPLHLFLPIFTVRTNKKAICFHMNIYQINTYICRYLYESNMRKQSTSFRQIVIFVTFMLKGCFACMLIKSFLLNDTFRK